MVTTTLKDKVIFITGGSRGIGHQIALRCARDGAKIVIAAKTATAQANLEGTIYTAAKDIENAGGKALPLIVDVREEEMVVAAIQKTVDTFGGIDILINNASAINLASTLDMPMKRYDLLQSVNARGTFMCSKHCIPHLKNADNPHILTLSPPLNIQAKWFQKTLGYTMSKFGMSMCTLGLAAELASVGIAVNSLWPKTIIATAAISVNLPKEIYQASRKPEIVADAAHIIFNEQ